MKALIDSITELLNCIDPDRDWAEAKRARAALKEAQTHSIKVGSRIKVVAGFSVDATGTVRYIEPCGKLWVRRDHAESDVFYHLEEVVRIEE